LPEYVADTVDGLGGKVPSSYFWNKLLISACRQVHWSLVVTLDPPANVKGSGKVDVEAPKAPGMDGHVAVPPPVEVVVGVMDVVRVAGGVVGSLVVGALVVGTTTDEVGAVPGRH